MDSMSRQEQLGQYFTTNLDLQRAVFGFIKNDTKLILEPSVGRGDLVAYVQSQNPLITFDMYEIDDTIELLPDIDSDRIIFDDFLNQEITQKYYTIIGNPPYVKINKGNLYIEEFFNWYSFTRFFTESNHPIIIINLRLNIIIYTS